MANTQEAENTIETKRYNAQAGKYLTFQLVDEEYGIEILKVKEIIGLMDITPVPRTPHYVRGVINLRGKIIPVIDLRMKFDMEMQENTPETCIIVVDVAGPKGIISIGLLVDAVSEVLDIEQKEIEGPPAFGSGIEVDYILGIAKVKTSVKILLDIDKVLDNVVASAITDIMSEADGEHNISEDMAN